MLRDGRITQNSPFTWFHLCGRTNLRPQWRKETIRLVVVSGLAGEGHEETGVTLSLTGSGLHGYTYASKLIDLHLPFVHFTVCKFHLRTENKYWPLGNDTRAEVSEGSCPDVCHLLGNTANVPLTNGWAERHRQSKTSKMLTTAECRWWVYECLRYNFFNFSVCLKIFIIKYWRQYTIEKNQSQKSILWKDS